MEGKALAGCCGQSDLTNSLTVLLGSRALGHCSEAVLGGTLLMRHCSAPFAKHHARAQDEGNRGEAEAAEEDLTMRMECRRGREGPRGEATEAEGSRD